MTTTNSDSMTRVMALEVANAARCPDCGAQLKIHEQVVTTTEAGDIHIAVRAAPCPRHPSSAPDTTQVVRGG